MIPYRQEDCPCIECSVYRFCTEDDMQDCDEARCWLHGEEDEDDTE